jgi:hypothetical protein
VSAATLQLAGETFVFDGLLPSQLRSLQTRYAARLHPAHASEGFAVAIAQAPRSDFREIDTRGWEYSVDLRWAADAFELDGLRVRAAVSFGHRRATIWTCVDAEDEFWGVVENVLRPMLAVLLLRRGGLLVHSAAVDGLLFAGQSGAGKSTIARLGSSAGLPVLSDDLNALIPGDGGFLLQPLPFTGDLEEHELSDAPALLRAVLSLEKGADESLRDLGVAAAVALLVRCAPYVNRDPHHMDELVDRAATIARSARRASLTFRRDGNPWPILKAL